MPRFTYAPFTYRTPPELNGGKDFAAPIAIIGAGPVGLALAIDLALHGIASVVLDDNNSVSVGSRAICWAKRTLEIFQRLGIGERMVAKGVTWKVGRLFHGNNEVWSFDLLPEEGHRNPAFVNLQQYHVEQYLVERCANFPELIDLRWKNKVVNLEQNQASATLHIQTPDGDYNLDASYVIACDGARSPTRTLLGLEFQGQFFEEQFLIADVEMKSEQPSERWFWFEPNFHNGQSALLHKQPDNIYRIDLQLGSDADSEAEKQPKRVIPRIAKALGHKDFELDWVSIYTFQCRRLESFVHGRVIFAGDSAHVVSPFGARGGNGGIQDIDNLSWKLASILKGDAPEKLLQSYSEERIHGADENIKNSARTSKFMSPDSALEHMLRGEVLRLAKSMPFARRLINSGRLSLPCSLEGLSLQTPNHHAPIKPGTPCVDAPLQDGYLLEQLGGGFVLICTGAKPQNLTDDLKIISSDSAILVARYGANWTYLVRPDQHIAAAWQNPSADDIAAALHRSKGN